MAKAYHTSPVIRVSPPRKKDILTMRFLICCGVCSMIIFLAWFSDTGHIGHPLLYWMLTFALGFKLMKMLQEWYHYWSVSVPERPPWKTRWSVDVLTTACPGEPREMIIRTLEAMQAIRYPHTSYLCDEGDDPVLKKACEELGVIHVTRKEKKDAKAGNINNALRQATGDICVILDPDHVPLPGFLDRVLPYFEDPDVGYVQCVQAYGNREESFIARAAAEQSYHFYGPMMMCMNSYGTVQAIGANCTFRRKALDSIGGHAPGLAEDMHTAMRLQAKGWKPVYIPEILSRGLVPATLSSYYKQQLKWSRGCFELLFRTYPLLFGRLTWRQRLHHFIMPLYFLFGLVNFFDLAVPVIALGLAHVPWQVEMREFAFSFLLLCGLAMVIRLYAQRWLLEEHERGLHLAGGMLRTATWWILLIGFIYALFNIKVPYIPTPKEDEHRNCWKLCLPNIFCALACIIFIAYGLRLDWTPYSLVMAGFALINAAILIYVTLVSQQKLLHRAREKMAQLSWSVKSIAAVNMVAGAVQRNAWSMLQKAPIAIILAFSLLLLSYNQAEEKTGFEPEGQSAIGFYLGASFSELESPVLEQHLGRSYDVIALHSRWGEPLPLEEMRAISARGAVPLIRWKLEPESFAAILNKRAESCLAYYASEFRDFAEPVFINFCPGFDTTARQPEQFKKAWQYVHFSLS
ncbi:MAG: cellulose synthase catalytic subunit, partial [Bacteroidota bacterium]